MKKTTRSVGLDIDAYGVRAVVTARSYLGNSVVDDIENVVTITSDMTHENEALDTLKHLKNEISAKPIDHVVSCLAGKQVYASRMSFKMLPSDELLGALRLELRKTLPFNVDTATIEYQILESSSEKQELQILVTAVATDLLHKHTSSLKRCGLQPEIVDIVPTALANTAWHLNKAASDSKAVVLCIHFAPHACTLVFEGAEAPFFCRTIYLPEEASALDNERKTADSLIDEISRSLVFYKKTYRVPVVDGLVMLGSETFSKGFKKTIVAGIGLDLIPTTRIILESAKDPQPDGVFDCAMVLALRGFKE